MLLLLLLRGARGECEGMRQVVSMVGLDEDGDLEDAVVAAAGTGAGDDVNDNDELVERPRTSRPLVDVGYSPDSASDSDGRVHVGVSDEEPGTWVTPTPRWAWGLPPRRGGVLPATPVSGGAAAAAVAVAVAAATELGGEDATDERGGVLPTTQWLAETTTPQRWKPHSPLLAAVSFTPPVSANNSARSITTTTTTTTTTTKTQTTTTTTTTTRRMEATGLSRLKRRVLRAQGVEVESPAPLVGVAVEEPVASTAKKGRFTKPKAAASTSTTKARAGHGRRKSKLDEDPSPVNAAAEAAAAAVPVTAKPEDAITAKSLPAPGCVIRDLWGYVGVVIATYSVPNRGGSAVLVYWGSDWNAEEFLVRDMDQGLARRIYRDTRPFPAPLANVGADLVAVLAKRAGIKPRLEPGTTSTSTSINKTKSEGAPAEPRAVVAARLSRRLHSVNKVLRNMNMVVWASGAGQAHQPPHPPVDVGASAS